MMFKRFMSVILMVSLMAFASACSVFKDSPREALSAAQGSYAIGLSTANSLFNQGDISPEDWLDEVVPVQQKANEAISTAEKAIIHWETFKDKDEAMPAVEFARNLIFEFLALVEKFR